MRKTTLDDAVELTLAQLGSEFGGASYLSADAVASTDDDRPILSVIHLDDRRHWNLTVSVDYRDHRLPRAELITRHVDEIHLARELDTATDGDVFMVVPAGSSRYMWALTVTVLEPARI